MTQALRVTQITLSVCTGEEQREQITLGVCAGEEQVMQITLCVRGVGARCANNTSTQSGSHLHAIPQSFRVRQSHAIQSYIRTIRSGSHIQTVWAQGRDALLVSCVTSPG